MAYAESFKGGPKFRHNRVISRINLGSAKAHDHYWVVQAHSILQNYTKNKTLQKILQNYRKNFAKNFAKLHQKYVFSYRSNQKLLKNEKRVRMLRNPGRTPNICEKPALLLLKLLGFAFQFFILGSEGEPWHSGFPLGTLVVHFVW